MSSDKEVLWSHSPVVVTLVVFTLVAGFHVPFLLLLFLYFIFFLV